MGLHKGALVMDSKTPYNDFGHVGFAEREKEREAIGRVLFLRGYKEGDPGCWYTLESEEVESSALHDIMTLIGWDCYLKLHSTEYVEFPLGVGGFG
jgi:hypothetical protein